MSSATMETSASDASLSAPAPEGGRRGRFTRFADIGWATPAVLVLSCVLHLWRLGLRPLAHDEAIDAGFAWQARSGGIMRYDPVYHGPLRFYLEGFVFRHFGTTPAWTRLVAVLAGIAATVIIARSVDTLGRIGAPVAALLFTVSPTVLTVTRTGREDSLVVLVSLGLLLVVARALTAPRTVHVIATGVLLAVSFALKETTFLFGFSAACFGAGVAVAAARRAESQSRRALRRLSALGKDPWLWAVSAFLLVFLFVFTSAFRYAHGFNSGLTDGIRYWWSQHSVGRGDQRWFFYATIYAAYEWLTIPLALVGLVVTWRRRSLVGAWFASMAAVQFALYSWAGEKFAWLAVHPLVPIITLAGMGAQAISARVTATVSRRALAIGLAVASVASAAVATRPAITDGADPRELLVTVQTSTDVPRIASRLAAGQRAGTILRILIDERDGGSWPWFWYVHGLHDVSYLTMDSNAIPTDYDAMIVSAGPGPITVPEGFTAERFRLRVWWLPDYHHASVADLVRWFFTRHTWNDTASSDQFLVMRSSAIPRTQARSTAATK